MSFFRVLQHPRAYFPHSVRGYATSPPITEKVAAKSKKTPINSTEAPPPQSSCPPDTIIPGVNYLKGQPPVLALADDQYPSWLWTILQPKVWPDDGPGGKAERVQRRKENKQRIKDRNFMSTQ